MMETFCQGVFILQANDGKIALEDIFRDNLGNLTRNVIASK